MTRATSALQTRGEYAAFGRDERRDRTAETTWDAGQIDRKPAKPVAKVPMLDWPSDLFASDATLVEVMAEDDSFRYDSPAVWYGNHIQAMHA